MKAILPLIMLAVSVPTKTEVSRAAQAEQTTLPPAYPNRTVPKVEPPKTGLEFSAQPTVQEFFRARVFEEPLVPIGGVPGADENIALAAALLNYAKRSGLDDFASLTGFLEKHPKSPWRAALLTGLGLEYYNTAHYSLALEAWEEAWPHAKDSKDAKGKAIADRAAGELAYMYARLGRMTELEALLKSVEGRAFVGAATERITGAREGLWNMQNRPEISFKCGPYALQQILLSDEKLLTVAPTNARTEIANAASTQQGFSLPQVAELSRKVGLNYQMAFRSSAAVPAASSGGVPPPDVGTAASRTGTVGEPAGGDAHATIGGEGGDFIVPSVVHWKVGHYAALVRQEGDRFLLEDPTFGNTVWATRQALEAEASGYFLIPPGSLPRGWRSVDAQEGASVWGKGFTTASDPEPHTPEDPRKPDDCEGGGGMAVSSVHLMLVSLNIVDTPVGYTPPVGPPVQFTVRYNQREARQPASFTYANFGPKWTCDWISYITDNPKNPLADVKFYAPGGGTRTFSTFNPGTQTFGFEQYDQAQLKRTSTNSYELIQPDGSKLVFTNSDGATGTSRKIFLTHILDPFGNALALTYDASLRLIAITDAIGQLTTLDYVSDDLGDDEMFYLIAKVTDPFGRFATFEYDFSLQQIRLTKITDVIGLTSQFVYLDIPNNPFPTIRTDFIQALITPYGTNTFVATSGGTRSLETVYADGSRDRVEYTQAGIPAQPDPPSSVPAGMAVVNDVTLAARNTFYWSRTACASSYGDYTKAKIYHWLHKNTPTTGGIIESTKEALEGRVWYDYGQGFGAAFAGNTSRPAKIGRVLDDGTTQLFTYAYNGFGHVTNSIDPLGRTFSYLYASNGIDLLEARQTRVGNNELLYCATYNAQHRPLTTVGASGQTNTFTYNHDDTLKSTAYLNAAIPTPGVSYTYDPNYRRHVSMTDGTGTTLYSYHPVSSTPALGANQLASVDGPLPNDTITYEYDELGRRISTAINGVATRMTYDADGRAVMETNALGAFTYAYDGASGRLLTNVFPNGLRAELGYGGNLEDRELERITHKVGATPISEFLYGRDHLAHRITAWSQQVGAAPPSLHTFAYDDADQLLSASVTNAGNLVNTFGYSYDPLGNRLTQQVGLSNSIATYNALNQLSTSTAPGAARTNEWDAKDRLVAVNAGNQRTEVTYDGTDRMVSIRQLTNGIEASFRRLVWCDNEICEERDASGAVTKRFFDHGMRAETGPAPGNYFYTRDHLGSIRELTDSSGTLRARYSYEPFVYCPPPPYVPPVIPRCRGVPRIALRFITGNPVAASPLLLVIDAALDECD